MSANIAAEVSIRCCSENNKGDKNTDYFTPCTLAETKGRAVSWKAHHQRLGDTTLRRKNTRRHRKINKAPKTPSRQLPVIQWQHRGAALPRSCYGWYPCTVFPRVWVVSRPPMTRVIQQGLRDLMRRTFRGVSSSVTPVISCFRSAALNHRRRCFYGGGVIWCSMQQVGRAPQDRGIHLACDDAASHPRLPYSYSRAGSCRCAC